NRRELGCQNGVYVRIHLRKGIDVAQFADGEGISTGINGLDSLLDGGFAFNRLHLVEGHPGTGKTTLALQFLMEGRRRGEKGLYITLSETKAELLQVAESHGWSLDGI